MLKTKLIILLLILFSIIFSLSIIIFLNFAFYDQNGYLNFLENRINEIFKKHKFSNYEKERITIINIEDKTSSQKFMHFLFSLKAANPKYILIDLKSDFLNDNENIPLIYDFIKNEKNIYGVITADNNFKTIQLSEYHNNKALIKNCLELKNINNKYMFAAGYNYTDIKINSKLKFPEKKTGFAPKYINFGDADNVDLLIRFNDKYLASIPFIMSLNKSNTAVDQLKFDLYKTKYGSYELNFDQKGKAGFMHNIKFDIADKDNNTALFRYGDWEKNLDSRYKALAFLKEINIIQKNDLKGYELFLKENEIIGGIYDYPPITDNEQNIKLNESKNMLAVWKSFIKTGMDNFNDSIVIIGPAEDLKWHKNFYYQKKIFETGINLKRIPLELTLIFSILLFIVIFALSMKYGILKIIPVIICILLTLSALASYFILRLYFKTDFPFNCILITALISLFSGLSMRFLILKIWSMEFGSIFKNNISRKKIPELLKIYKSKKWDTDLKEYISTFLTVNMQEIIKKDMTESDVFIMTKLINQLEKILKDNKGFILDNNPAGITCVFGIPFISDNHAKEAVNACYEISRELLSYFQDSFFSITIHTKKEWFKLNKSANDINYKSMGNSLVFLGSMTKYAKKFNTKMIITDYVYKMSKTSLPVRMLDRVKIHGINKSVRLFELLEEERLQMKSEFINFFHAGLKLFENRKWNEAGKYFKQCLKIDQNDIPSKIYLDRCREFSYVAPNDSWDGTFEIE